MGPGGKGGEIELRQKSVFSTFELELGTLLIITATKGPNHLLRRFFRSKGPCHVSAEPGNSWAREEMLEPGKTGLLSRMSATSPVYL